MPIQYVHGNMFEANAEVLVNPVNCEGVMGAGLALEFKRRNPVMFLKYRQICEKRMLKPGMLMLLDSDDQTQYCANETCYYEGRDDVCCETCHYWMKEPSHKILLFPTKDSWRNPSHVDYIEAGLRKFVKTYKEKGIESIAFPRIGCGLGGLNWNKQVKPLMEKHLFSLPIRILIYQ